MLKNTLIMGLSLLIPQIVQPVSVSAQELLTPPANAPSALGLPGFELNGQGSGTREALPEYELPEAASSNSTTTPALEPIATPMVSSELQPSLIEDGEQYRVFDYQPALLESTGTWLRRGFWYSEVDAVLSDRLWRRDDVLLAFQNTDVINGFVDTGLTSNILTVNGGRSGAEASPRLKLGRFLFRDQKNRDHTAEFIAFGGGQWSQSGALDAVGAGTLSVGAYSEASLAASGRIQVVRFPMDNGNVSFDGATSMRYDYESRFNNFELNYHVKSRMSKDRMEMDPSGRWTRRAKPSITRSLMAGIRYFDLNENFDWNAFGIDADNDGNTPAESGTYNIRTDNDLIGTQLGFSWNYERPRWSLGLLHKSGMFLNHTNLVSNFEVTGGVTSGNNEVEVNNLSFITEGRLIGKYHVLQNLSIRVGMEALYVSSLANAAEQINFAPVSSQIVDDGDSVYLGGSIGFEGYW